MHKAPATLRTLLVDDHPLIREGIRSSLATVSDVTVVGEAADGKAALRQVERLAPDLVLLDVNLPRLDGLGAAAIIVKKWPRVRVLMLTVHTNSEYVIEIIRSGAHGYVSKDAPPARLLRAIRRVGRGGTYFEPGEVMQYLRRYRPEALSAASAPAQELTARERDVVTLIAHGLTNRQISARLRIGVRTVETHRERLMRKLGLHTVAGLTRYALARGWSGTPGGHSDR